MIVILCSMNGILGSKIKCLWSWLGVYASWVICRVSFNHNDCHAIDRPYYMLIEMVLDRFFGDMIMSLWLEWSGAGPLILIIAGHFVKG